MRHLETTPSSGHGSAPVFVIGAVNMDLSGTPENLLCPGDSNPGHIRMSSGGVGRNIAENLSRLGYPVSLITVTGNDYYAGIIREDCRKAGIDLSYSFTLPGERTSAYLCLNQQNGDLCAAISDMTIYEQLTPALLAPLLPALNRGCFLIADANLPEATLEWIASHVTVPLAADPVSVAKAPRLRSILNRLVFCKPNVPEAKILCGFHTEASVSLSDLAEGLLNQGTSRIFLSLGADGVWAGDATGHAMLSCFPCHPVNTTGCGDAFVAAAADAWLQGLSTAECARHGLAAAAICAESPFAVSRQMSPEELKQKLSLSPGESCP